MNCTKKKPCDLCLKKKAVDTARIALEIERQNPGTINVKEVYKLLAKTTK